jgi:predicted Zn-dependent protease
MGEIYNQEGHYEAGIAQYQAALKKQPAAVGIHSPIGVAYFLLNQIEPAEKELLLAVQETPDDPLANLYLGNLELRAHQFTKALSYLKRAAELQPKNVENRILLGRCYLALGQLQEAKEDLLAAAVDPTDPRSHYMLAEVYQKLNQPAGRQREIDLFNKLSEAQRAKGTSDAGAVPGPAPGSNP